MHHKISLYNDGGIFLNHAAYSVALGLKTEVIIALNEPSQRRHVFLDARI